MTCSVRATHGWRGGAGCSSLSFLSLHSLLSPFQTERTQKLRIRVHELLCDCVQIGENGKPTPVPSRHDKASILEACDASLKRLQTSYIDLYQLHW